MKLSKAEEKRLFSKHEDLIRELGDYISDDWRERFIVFENQDIDYYFYLWCIITDLRKILQIEKVLNMDIKNTYRYRHKLNSDNDFIKSINKIFPSNESLMEDEDVARSSFIIFMKGEILKWFPSQSEIICGTYFSNIPMLNGVNDLIVKNFFRITNKMLKRFKMTLMEKSKK